MSISSFSFKNHLRGWELNQVSFDDFNLLVGISGAGKTQILRSLQSVCQAGLQGIRGLNACSWALELSILGDRYKWSAEVSSKGENPHFVTEAITKNGNQALIQRNKESFVFKGDDLPKLKNTESAITLLRDEPLLMPIYKALSRFLFSNEIPVPPFLSEINFFDTGRMILGPFPDNLEEIAKLRAEATTLIALRERTDDLLLRRAFVLQEEFVEEFERIKEDYRDIFPTVSNLKIGLVEELAPTLAKQFSHFAESFVLGIKETGVQGWIVGGQISAGMQRTLVHLLEIALAPAGTVIVVDEFENSLGVNCLAQVTDHFLRRTDLQFILTSHHPYVINNIPYRYWKLVSRTGSTVSVTNATDIQAINTKSSHDRFMLLLNSKEYQEGVR